jgi:hypothetical protein
MNEKKSNLFGIIAFIINIPVFLINLFLFLPLLVEQIKIGKGTNIELGALWIWLIDIMIIAPLIVGLVLTIISTIKRDYKWRIISNYFLIIISITMIVLTTLFMDI